MQLNNIEDHENGFYQVEFDVEGENIYIEFYLQLDKFTPSYDYIA